MAQQPSTPVKVPASATTYSPATLDPDLRSQINTILLRDGHVSKCVLHLPSSTVLCLPPTHSVSTLLLATSLSSFCLSVHIASTNGPRIQERLLHTLNSNASNWPTALQDHALTLLRSGQVQTFPALLRQVLDDIQEASSASTTSPNKPKPKANGTSGTGDKSALAVPQVVVDEVLSVTRECLKDVCEIEEPNGRVN